MKYYILKSPKKDEYVAIDHSAGGMPYYTEIIGAKFFKSLDDVMKYNSSFLKDEYEIHELQFSFKRRKDIEDAQKELFKLENSIKDQRNNILRKISE
jgi:hypothetical protein